MSLLDRLNAALARKADQDLLNDSKSNKSFPENTQQDSDGWMETGQAAKSKVIPVWETKVRVVDLHKLVWAPIYNLKAKMCGVLCDKKDFLSQKSRMPADDEVVVEFFNLDREAGHKNSRLILAYEKDLMSFNGNKRDMNYPIDSKLGFRGDNTDLVWSIELMDKMHNALEHKFNQRAGKQLFNTMQQTALSFLKLALEEVEKNKAAANELKHVAHVVDMVKVNSPKQKIDIRSFAPAPKSMATTQTLAVGDWICWTHKIFKNSVMMAKIVNITDDPSSPLELSTLDTIRGHDTIQKCVLKSSSSSGSGSGGIVTESCDDYWVTGPSPATADTVSSPNRGSSNSRGADDEKRKDAWFGREAGEEVEFYRDSEGLERPRGGAFQLLSQFKLIRSSGGTNTSSSSGNGGSSGAGYSQSGRVKVDDDEVEEVDEIVLTSTKRKSDTLSQSCKRALTSPMASPLTSPKSGVAGKTPLHSSKLGGTAARSPAVSQSAEESPYRLSLPNSKRQKHEL